MKKVIIISLIVCFNLLNSHARYDIPKQGQALEFLKRIILVELKEYDNEEVKKLMFETYEEDYKLYLSEFNSSFQYAIEHYWKLGNKVEFKTKKEVEQLLKTDKSKYAVIKNSFDERKRITYTPNTQSKNSKIITVFKVYQFTTYIDDKEIFSIPMPSCFLALSDFIFIAQQFNIYMETGKNDLNQRKFFDISGNLDTLKNKILLLPNYWLDDEMTDEKITKNYGYPYKIADYDLIEEVVKNQDTKYAYVAFIFCAVLENPSWVTIDAVTGKILTLVTEGGLDIGIAFLPPKEQRYHKTTVKRHTIFKSVWGKNIGGGMLVGFRSKIAQMMNKK